MKKAVIGGMIIMAGLIYLFFDPADSILFPQCPFYVITGWQCPGCGSQRAIHALLHGNFVTAIQYNALIVISLPAIAILYYSELFRSKKSEFYRYLHRPKFIWICFGTVIIWWIGRNIV